MNLPEESPEISTAVNALRKGNLIVIPTETVYGLCADPWNETAIQKIFQIKGRNANKPISLLIADFKSIPSLTQEVPEAAKELMKKYWPGPLTLIFKKSERVPDYLTTGRDTVGLRMPDHPIALAIIRRFGKPIAATSANLSGKPDAFTLKEAIRALQKNPHPISCWIEGGQTQYACASAVVDVTTSSPRLLRPGPVEIRSCF